MLARLCFAMAIAVALVACDSPAPTGEDSGGLDAGEGMDGGALDASGDGGSVEPCAVDEDCADELFCDGVERCMPGATDADPRGCVEAAAGPCAEGEVCDEDGATCDAVCADADRDGHGDVACGGDDCDDTDANRYPGNVEVCDMAGHDEDCNTDTFGFLDADSDGSGSYVCCNVVAGGDLHCGDDCNDGDSTVNPRGGDGPPLYCDGIDNDCSGTADEGCPCVEGETQECGTEPQRMRIGVCRPGTQVCSGGEFTATCIGATAAGEEICDGLDNDCDMTVDEAVLRTYYPDVDGDGFGAIAGAPTTACSAPTGYASNATDCDDTIASVNPGATEVCNARDDNCAGGVDEGFIGTFYADTDGDGFGNAAMATMACSPPTGYVRNATDCDDANGSRNPATIEGCNGVDDNCNGMTDEGLLRTFYLDSDGDAWGVAGTTMMACTVPAGYADRSGDCDDSRAAANPAGTEVCNGQDDNCAGGVDEGVLRTFYLDADHDSFGLSSSTMTACTAPANHSDRGGDCNDASASVNPSAAETCNGRDDNCDGATDTGCTCTDGATRDCGPTTETGECAFGQQTCLGGSWGGCVGAVLSTAESCNGRDDDCDGTVDNGTTVMPCYRDGDGDGYGTGGATTQCRDATRTTFGFCPVGWVNNNTDCNDGVSTIRPGATETCDGVDQDCDGMADDGATIACYGDADADGFGTGSAVQRCADPARTAFGMCPSGFTNVATDCNDGASTVRPGAPEICNDVDDDCDMTVDDGVGASPCYTDADGDGYGSGGALTRCRDATRMAQGYCPVGYTNVATDCNDATSAIRPGGTETCNGLDDDCDGMTDELLLATGCYVDGDSDGYGSGSASTQCRDAARSAYGYCPVGYTTATGDCNDTNGGVRPGATETCNGVDDDCDTMVDDGASASPCYADADGDGYGAGSSSTQCRDASRSTYGYCPVGYTNVATDCNDGNASVRPGGTETCNGLDDNCNGSTDESLTVTGCYVDGDSDGYGGGSSSTQCRDGARSTYGYCPAGYTNATGDCNDTNSSVKPGATEACNGVDDDCDGTPDDGATVTGCYTDSDGDGYGAGSSSTRCRDATRSAYGYCPVGYTNNATDCNDSNASVRPGGTETCNAIDDNCDGSTDESLTVTGCYVDGDADGYGAGSSSTQCRDASRMAYGYCPIGYTNNATDCNNAVASIRPGGTEACNAIDDDCDGTADDGVLITYYRDGDNDGYGNATTTTGCSAPSGYVASGGDCDDTRTNVHPNAPEVCNSVDENCVAGTSDEPTSRFYTDADSDGYGTASSYVDACEQPSGHTLLSGDCNDANSGVRPTATETCNGVDDDCDGTTDDGAAAQCVGAYPFAQHVATWTCSAGACGTTCAAGYANCDSNPINGCEVDTTSDATHCGSCTISCGTGALCDAGTCDVLVDLVAGADNACAMWDSRRMICWGEGDAGGLARDLLQDSSVPVHIEDLSALRGDTGRPVWDVGQGGVSGQTHLAAATGDAGSNILYGWGWNYWGQVGDGTLVNPRITPEYVTAGGTDEVSAGTGHTCLRRAGQVYCWGKNSNGQLGTGAALPGANVLSVPASAVVGLPAVAEVSVGADTSCARTAAGTVYCWGYDGQGQIGNGAAVASPGYATPQAITAYTDFINVEVGYFHSCGLRTGGVAVCWGNNGWGGLGNNSVTSTDAPVPVYTTSRPTAYSDLAVGNGFTCGVASLPAGMQGQVWCWGRNTVGQLGQGTADGANHTTPVRAGTAMGLAGVIRVVAGEGFVCAGQSYLTGRIRIYCWGENDAGQLGRGMTSAYETNPGLVTNIY